MVGWPSIVPTKLAQSMGQVIVTHNAPVISNSLMAWRVSPLAELHGSRGAHYSQGNVDGWKPSSNDPNAGVGGHGSCCAEMDIWEANSVSAAVTPHSCDTVTQTMCNGDACGGTYSATRYAGTCDPDGCDFNSYRMGDTSFYGKGMTVDTSKVFTVVTQFIGNPLTEIKRFYVQGGK